MVHPNHQVKNYTLYLVHDYNLKTKGENIFGHSRYQLMKSQLGGLKVGLTLISNGPNDGWDTKINSGTNYGRCSMVTLEVK